jgi:hypothetical protein
LEETKEFGDKIKCEIKFDVFIKCMGESSQVSKSVEPKREKNLFESRKESHGITSREGSED